MIKIGDFNSLCIQKILKNGAILGNETTTNIFINSKEIINSNEVNSKINVFIYHNTKGELVATKAKPYATVNNIAKLEAIDHAPMGTFLDWGLPKQLLLPLSEQRKPTEIGKFYLVMLFLDKVTSRVTASSKIEKFLSLTNIDLKVKQQVNIIIERTTDIGLQVIINSKYWGVLHDSDIHQRLSYGDQLKGYIKNIRDDGKIDVSLYQTGYTKIETISEIILAYIENHSGNIRITDKSSPSLISQEFQISKATYKKALGLLYKSKKIIIHKDYIELAKI
jgi:uncharacterized protein